GLLFLGGTSLLISIVGDLNGLITISVFSLSVAYLATGLATVLLSRRNPDQRLQVPGAGAMPLAAVLASLFLLSQAGYLGFALGIPLVAVGTPVYFLLAPRRALVTQRDVLLSRVRQLSHVRRISRLFLAGLVRFLSRIVRSRD
ncbi:MAG: hypothetical protein ACUVX1_14120, partial [Chloroflexota bacterium]